MYPSMERLDMLELQPAPIHALRSGLSVRVVQYSSVRSVYRDAAGSRDLPERGRPRVEAKQLVTLWGRGVGLVWWGRAGVNA